MKIQIEVIYRKKHKVKKNYCIKNMNKNHVLSTYCIIANMFFFVYSITCELNINLLTYIKNNNKNEEKNG